jgi:membrane protease YdiL (CAAX protease family)
MKKLGLHWLYFTIVFIAGYLWQLLIFYTGGIDSKFFSFMMFFPAIVAIVFRIKGREGFRNVGWGLRRWWYVIPILIVPLLVILAVGSILIGSNCATLSGKHFIFKDGMVQIQNITLILGNRMQGIAFFALNLVLSLFVQSLMGSVVTIGEEFGWRGYVQEKMMRNFGLNRGLIILGLIWGYWHLPIGLMGWNFPNHAILGALVLTPLSTVFFGIFLGWLYLRSRSIWMPILAHAAMNLTGMLLLSEIAMKGSSIFHKLLFIAAWGVVAGVCIISLNKKKPMLWQEKYDSNEGSGEGENGRKSVRE